MVKELDAGSVIFMTLAGPKATPGQQNLAIKKAGAASPRLLKVI